MAVESLSGQTYGSVTFLLTFDSESYLELHFYHVVLLLPIGIIPLCLGQLFFEES